MVRVEGDVRAEMAMPMRDCRVYAASLPFLVYIFLRELSLATLFLECETGSTAL